MSLPAIQAYVSDMCESVDAMKITAKQKDFARAVMRAAIEFANARHGMHASQNARAAALPSTVQS
ncbi:hypothetical protein ABIF07_001039 [Bradyrhizobium elkanii]|uniref:hypothetical protein n=1 Tax=Bradyrhizobium elkanii TaxID=29448 RepID=UPI0021679634|nr:hypothetical protein [Bradyrhizobium elkanii]MCS3692045.1 hypothetical protein [Bradyrhizobium elkanii]